MAESIYDEYPSMTLAKEQHDQNIEPLKLGQRIKDIRSKLGITLEEASQRTGLARSTLSKIENEQISPTFQAMQKLALGLQIDMPQLFEPPRKKVATGRR
ncbi:helix-turn-helix domain-containing protein, partial [Vibrio parahaemolyticus]